MVDSVENINKKYLELKGLLSKVPDKVTKFEEQLATLEEEKLIARADEVKARRSSDSVAEKTAQDEIEKINKEITKIKEDCAKEINEMSDLQRQIDACKEMIQTDPEMKKHLDEVLAKRYERQIRNIEEGTYDKQGNFVKEGKKQALEKKDKMMELQQVIVDHPTSVGNELIGVIKDTQKIKALNEELEEIYKSNPENSPMINELQAQIPEAKEKLTARKSTLMDNLSKYASGITAEDINELAEKGFAKGKMR